MSTLGDIIFDALGSKEPTPIPTPDFLRRYAEATERAMTVRKWTEHATTDEALDAIVQRRAIAAETK